MFKKFISIILIFLTTLAVQAYEDCIIFNKGKLTDISIEDNSVVDIYPLITIGNDKNTLIVHPLKTGNTRFCVLKNGKDIIMFNIDITEYGTKISEKDGFEIYTLDSPLDEPDFALDEPPEMYIRNDLSDAE